jgi:shikimate kinase
MMGSGKTSVALLLAQQTMVPFFDTDRLVEEEAACTVAELFATEGESGFRARETAAVARAAAELDAVIATGGGAILNPDNVETMRECGPVIWLQALPATLAARLAADNDRPLLGDNRLDTLTVLLARRAAFYEAAADHVISTDGISVARVALLVGEIWNES